MGMVASGMGRQVTPWWAPRRVRDGQASHYLMGSETSPGRAGKSLPDGLRDESGMGKQVTPWWAPRQVRDGQASHYLMGSETSPGWAGKSLPDGLREESGMSRQVTPWWAPRWVRDEQASHSQMGSETSPERAGKSFLDGLRDESGTGRQVTHSLMGSETSPGRAGKSLPDGLREELKSIPSDCCGCHETPVQGLGTLWMFFLHTLGSKRLYKNETQSTRSVGKGFDSQLAIIRNCILRNCQGHHSLEGPGKGWNQYPGTAYHTPVGCINEDPSPRTPNNFEDHL